MRGFVASVLVVAVLALAGCTGDPEPRFDGPTAEPSASAPTSSAAAEPKPWEERSKDGAVAFARHWIDVFNEATATGDVADLRASSSRQCTSCRALIAQVQDIYRGGGSVESDGWSVVGASPQPGGLTGKTEVVLRIDRSPQRVTDGRGRVDRFPGGEATFSFGLSWAGDSWSTLELVRL